ncbi:hypothetical protein GGX14DRAFT_620525 [Mycena pura]|uniref:Uncharacterized protein n=1 Tax=Mycena pura TaxID=153505 RepID=A0AAD6UJ71_9AGAR|nr:hypothetical protein GGX14DRAFT_620525 [Mycena pura]
MLSELLLESCEVANGDSMPSVSNVLRLCHFLYISKYVSIEDLEEWLPLLEPRSTAHQRSNSGLPLRPRPPGSDESNHLPTFLRKLPGITKLNMDLDWTDSPRTTLATLPADVLPVLAEFTGPIRALSLFLARDTLNAHRNGRRRQPRRLRHRAAAAPIAAHQSHPPHRVLQLLLHGNRFEAIFASLPRLEHPAAILSKLSCIPGISPHLQLVSLIWKCLDHVKPRTVDSIESDCDFPAVRAELVAQCPDLEVLWLDGRDFIFCWHTQADNMDETESDGDRPWDVEGVRFGWEALRQLPHMVYEDDDALVKKGLIHVVRLCSVHPALVGHLRVNIVSVAGDLFRLAHHGILQASYPALTLFGQQAVDLTTLQKFPSQLERRIQFMEIQKSRGINELDGSVHLAGMT